MRVGSNSDSTSDGSSPEPVIAARKLDNVLRVDTPENISFEYRLAGPFRRLFAYLLDLLVSIGGYWALILVVYLIAMFVLVPLFEWLGLEEFVLAALGVMGGFMTIGYFITYWFYGAYAETWFNGRTVGKAVAGMRVISADGHAIDGVQATLRNFFRLLDVMPIVPLAALFELPEDVPQLGLPTCLFGLLIMAITPRFQRLGDLVANTVVVNETRSQRPELEKFEDQRVQGLSEWIPDTLFVPPSMALAIADYVDHRRNLNYQRASEIASHLAVPMLERAGLPGDTDHDLFLCALYYKVFVHSETPQEETSTSSSPYDVHFGRGHRLSNLPVDPPAWGDIEVKETSS